MKDVKKSKSKKYLLVALGLTLLTAMMLPQNTYAALQSNTSTHYKDKKHPTDFMSEIRQMEAPNNAMGLKEEFNSDLTTKDGTPSNNIDVHMMKNTEYGAIAILAVSGYGNPNTMESSTIKSTTGNVTGVYYTTANTAKYTYNEFVAGGYSPYIFPGINKRYYEDYSGRTVKKGDALDLHWQGTSHAEWVNTDSQYFARNYYGYFGFDHFKKDSDPAFSRGVAVCGEGL